MGGGATVRVEATLTAVKYPKCAACGAPNPSGSARCACGRTFEVADVREETSIAVNVPMPFHARVLFGIGAWLREVAKRIEGV